MMNLQAAFSLYAGGEGSGCRGENCGRPRTGRTDVQKKGKKPNSSQASAIIKAGVAKYGVKKLAVDYERIVTKWTDCEEGMASGCGKLYKQPIVKLYQQLGLKPSAMEAVSDAIDEWSGESNNRFAKLAQDVVSGNLNTPIARGLAIEAALASRAVGGKTITLYRGVSGGHAQDIVDKAMKNRADTIIAKTRGADSWTDNPRTAREFGSVVLMQRVPASQLITTYRSNKILKNMGEKEYVVAWKGGKMPVFVPGMKINVEDDEGFHFAAEPLEIDLTDDENFNWMHRHANS